MTIITETIRPTALVTGASGFIGGRLAERLLEAGWSVRVLTRNAARLSPGLQSAEVVVGDLGDAAAMRRAVADVGVIFHCAANVNTWDSWPAYYQANVLGVKNLLEAIVQVNPGLARLLHVSTVDVYGFPESACDESCAPAAGGFAYGESKLQGEALVREFGERAGIPYTIVRPANVIGPGSQFIERIGAELRCGLMLTVNGGVANAGLVYIDNLIDYLLWAACAPQALQQCYNIRDNYDVSWAVFLNRFKTAIAGKGVRVDLPFAMADILASGSEYFYRLLLPDKEPLLHHLLVRIFGRTCGHSAEKIRSDSGFAGKLGFEEALVLSCRWFLANAKQD